MVRPKKQPHHARTRLPFHTRAAKGDQGMLTTKINVDGWNDSLAIWSRVMRVKPREAVKKQAGMLVQTLINFTAPKSLSKSKKKIDARVNARFVKLQNPERDFVQGSGGKHGRGDVYWYSWTPTKLYGVAREKVMVDATPEELRTLYYKTSNRGTIISGSHGRQSVRIWQKITVAKKTLQKTIKLIQDRLGLQKAGWLWSWRGLGSPTGLFREQQWVLKHEGKAKGFFVDGLGIPDAPKVTMINEQVGITKGADLFRKASRTRARAMLKDAANFVRYGKQQAGFK